MNWSELAEKVKPFAPVLGAALGGPIGPAIGVAAGAIANKLGVPVNPKAIAQAIAADPAADAKLEEVEAERATEVSRIMGADYTESRKQMAGHWMSWVISLVIVGMWGGWRVMLFFFHVPIENIPLIAPAETTATLNFAFAAVIGFWIGSSRGSAEKQRTIDKAISQ